ncbi:MAG: hypothetical protein R3A11_00960 [Bdellovibrionota bacterium]
MIRGFHHVLILALLLAVQACSSPSPEERPTPSPTASTSLDTAKPEEKDADPPQPPTQEPVDQDEDKKTPLPGLKDGEATPSIIRPNSSGGGPVDQHAPTPSTQPTKPTTASSTSNPNSSSIIPPTTTTVQGVANPTNTPTPTQGRGTVVDRHHRASAEQPKGTFTPAPIVRGKREIEQETARSEDHKKITGWTFPVSGIQGNDFITADHTLTGWSYQHQLKNHLVENQGEIQNYDQVIQHKFEFRLDFLTRALEGYASDEPQKFLNIKGALKKDLDKLSNKGAPILILQLPSGKVFDNKAVGDFVKLLIADHKSDFDDLDEKDKAGANVLVGLAGQGGAFLNDKLDNIRKATDDAKASNSNLHFIDVDAYFRCASGKPRDDIASYEIASPSGKVYAFQDIAEELEDGDEGVEQAIQAVLNNIAIAYVNKTFSMQIPLFDED